jgi:hypothetical protein
MSIQALKFAVVVMGILIVVGMVVMAVTIASRLSAMADVEPALADHIALSLPPGAVIVETDLDGDRLALRLETPEGPAVQVFDLASGALLSTIATVGETQ